MIKVHSFFETYQFERAKHACDYALSLYPNDIRLLELRAYILFENGDLEEAGQIVDGILGRGLFSCA